MYNDELSYTERLTNFDLPFLVDLRECKLQISYFGEIVTRLPEFLRPLMLTDVVEECLDNSCEESKVSGSCLPIVLVIRNCLIIMLMSEELIS